MRAPAKVIILCLYVVSLWLAFSKFKFVRWGWLSGTVSVLVGVFILATFLALFNYLAPSGRVTVAGRVVEVTPNVTGQIVANHDRRYVFAEWLSDRQGGGGRRYRFRQRAGSHLSLENYGDSHERGSMAEQAWRQSPSQAHTSARLAAHAASRPTVRSMCTRSNGVLRPVLIMAKASGDSGGGVSANTFRRIQDSFTTQGFRQARPCPAGRLSPACDPAATRG